MLTFTMNRIMSVKGVSYKWRTFQRSFNFFFLFQKAGELKSAEDEDQESDYSRFAVVKVGLDSLRTNVEAKKYRCIEAFHSDVKWLLHNYAIYQSK